jgi:Mini-chromosome maintenance replisome factor
MDTMIAKPLELIDRLLAEAAASGQSHEDAVKRAFEAALQDPECSARVPLLSKHNLQSGNLPANSLVRYRGMVQDMHAPEFYVGEFDEVELATGARRKVSTKYRLVLSLQSALWFRALCALLALSQPALTCI